MVVSILHPPVTYSPWVVTLGYILVLLGVASVPLVLAVTSSRRWRAWWQRRDEARDVRRALRALTRLERDVLRGAVQPADAASRASQTVRRFAATRTGISYDRMTLERLRAVAAPTRLEESVATLYGVAFAPAPDTDSLRRGIGAAREVVSRWTTS